MTVELARPHLPRISDIQAAVCRRFRVNLAEMIGPSRRPAIARPRMLAMYLALRLTHRSQPEIGRAFGGRDHSTVAHARDRVRELAERDREFAETVSLLETRLRELADNPPCSCLSCQHGSRRFPLDPPQLHLPMQVPGELPLERAA